MAQGAGAGGLRGATCGEAKDARQSVMVPSCRERTKLHLVLLAVGRLWHPSHVIRKCISKADPMCCHSPIAQCHATATLVPPTTMNADVTVCECQQAVCRSLSIVVQ
jgi:hypothetical protein